MLRFVSGKYRNATGLSRYTIFFLDFFNFPIFCLCLSFPPFPLTCTLLIRVSQITKVRSPCLCVWGLKYRKHGVYAYISSFTYICISLLTIYISLYCLHIYECVWDCVGISICICACVHGHVCIWMHRPVARVRRLQS